MARATFDAQLLLALQQEADGVTEEDALQEAALRALRAAHQLREPEKLASWVHTIVFNILLHQARQAVRAPHCATDDDLNLEHIPDQHTVEREEETSWPSAEAVRAAIARLSDPFRETLQRFYFEEQDTTTIAEAMQVPLRTVLTRLHRGRQQLRARLEQVAADDRQ
jgi:RNA polymerase sigma-70 factor (ECF subfamily)